MRHRHYPLNLNYSAKLLRKSGLVKKFTPTPNGLAACVGSLYKKRPEVIHTMECLLHCEEFFWLTHGQLVYFLEDAQLATNIMRSTYNLNTLDHVHDGGVESFILMLPESLAINGNTRGSAVQCTLMRHDERHIIFDHFFKAVGMPVPQHSYKGETGKFTLCLNYQESLGSNVYMRAVVPSTVLERILKMETVEEFSADMAANNQFDFLFGADLLPAEQAYQFELLRLVAGFLVYRHAMPERVREGLPQGSNGTEATHPVHKRPHAFTLHAPARKADTPSAHYRAWHFRQLLADRYYQGEHATKARGSRIVFVSDAFVGGKDVDAYTATKAPL